MNWGTMVQTVTEDTASMVSSDTVKRAICDSVRHHANTRFWWGDAEFETPLVEGVDTLRPGGGLPADMREVAGDSLYLTVEPDRLERFRVVRVASERMQELRASDYDLELPAYFDWWGGALRLYPITNLTGYTLIGRYVRDEGQPIYEYAGGAYTFYEPGRLRTIGDSYTSAWFAVDRAFEMVKQYAVYLIYQTRLRRFEEAQAALQVWAELKAVLEDERDGKDTPARIEPWL